MLLNRSITSYTILSVRHLTKAEILYFPFHNINIGFSSFSPNIKMDLREIGWDGMVSTGSIWLRIGTSRGLL
jgi:hypothetical protein